MLLSYLLHTHNMFIRPIEKFLREVKVKKLLFWLIFVQIQKFLRVKKFDFDDQNQIFQKCLSDVSYVPFGCNKHFRSDFRSFKTPEHLYKILQSFSGILGIFYRKPFLPSKLSFFDSQTIQEYAYSKS